MSEKVPDNEISVEEVKIEEVKVKPKRKCSEKQLAALAEGRKRNPRWLAKQARMEKEAENKNKD